MDITTYQVEGRVPVTVLQPHGDLDGRTYKDLIARGEEAFQAGGRDMIVDLGDVRYMSSSGVVALNSLARLLRGQKVPDLDAGWDALHDVERNVKQGLHPHLKLVNPQPAVDKLLGLVGLTQMFDMYPDVPSAVASF